jgi:rhombotail lipoprotein
MSINYRKSIWIVVTVLMTGCAGQQTSTKSSVVDYLYPKELTIVAQPSIPTLNIPIKVGIAFVPEQSPRSRGINIWSGVVGGSVLTEANKTNLLKKVADNFKKHDFVSDIEVIPSAYLTAGGGFTNLAQIKTMYGIDVIALVSYDQVQFTDQGLLSLTYWTLVGAYIVSGEKNDTSTLLDTAVYDIQSKSMLFRAPGTSNVKGRSTAINLSEELRRDSIKSFEDATINMVANLTVQLENFKDKIKQNPEQVNLVHREGYSGGGAMGPFETVIMMLLAAVLYSVRRMKSNR